MKDGTVGIRFIGFWIFINGLAGRSFYVCKHQALEYYEKICTFISMLGVLRFIIITTFILSLLQHSIYAQSADSLISIIQNTQNDITLAHNQYKMAKYYSQKDIKQSISYAKKALRNAQKTNHDSIIAQSKCLLGANYIKLGAYPEALDYLKDALNYFEETNDEKGKITTYKSIGDLFWYNQKYKQALDYYQELGKYADKVNDTISYIKSFISKGAVYGNINKLDTAILLFTKAYELSKSMNYGYLETLSKFNIGDALLFSNKPKKAIEIFNDILETTSSNENSYRNYAGLYNSLAQAYFKMGDYKKANKYNDQALLTAKKENLLGEINDYYATQYKIDSSEHKYKKALYSLLKNKQLTDSLNSKQHREYLTNFKLIYDLKKHQMEIDKLKLENKLSQNQLKRNRYYLTTGILVILLLLALFIIISRSKKELNIKNKKLDDQKEELESTLEKLKQTQTQLVQSEKMASLGIFTTGIAHEINNPLNYINGGIHILEDIRDEFEPDNVEEIKEKFNLALKMVEEGFSKSSNIVKSLMTFATRENKVQEKHSITTLLENTLFFLKPKLENITVETNFTENDELLIYPDKLHQTLINIIDNAIKATIEVEEKKIKVVTQKNKNSFSISIQNNGPKISKKHIDRIFDPFFTTRQPGEGVGMGLTISYNLIKEHQGTLKAQNIENGVEFIIELPLKKQLN